jgi:uracil-DNA glycosylase family 4
MLLRLAGVTHVPIVEAAPLAAPDTPRSVSLAPAGETAQPERANASTQVMPPQPVESLAGSPAAAVAPGPTGISTPPTAPTALPSNGGKLADVAAEVTACRKCGLCDGRTQTVFSDGSPTADIMFVGEGPGADEDAQGVPFVGKAGQLLTKIIEAMGFDRATDTYICNIVKCRPPDNRNPEPDEVAACLPYLRAQIGLVNPKAIVVLGSVALKALFGESAGITRMRGSFRDWMDIPVMPTFHPAYLLRNPGAKKDVWADVQQVRDLVRGAGGHA